MSATYYTAIRYDYDKAFTPPWIAFPDRQWPGVGVSTSLEYANAWAEHIAKITSTSQETAREEEKLGEQGMQTWIVESDVLVGKPLRVKVAVVTGTWEELERMIDRDGEKSEVKSRSEAAEPDGDRNDGENCEKSDGRAIEEAERATRA